MRENRFQPKVIKAVKERLPGCIVMKNDPNYIQGIPDLTVLYGEKWAFLETKRSRDASRRANQEYYIRKANEDGAYGAFIEPGNEEEVLSELQQALEPERKTRISRSQQVSLAGRRR